MSLLDFDIYKCCWSSKSFLFFSTVSCAQLSVFVFCAEYFVTAFLSAFILCLCFNFKTWQKKKKMDRKLGKISIFRELLNYFEFAKEHFFPHVYDSRVMSQINDKTWKCMFFFLRWKIWNFVCFLFVPQQKPSCAEAPCRSEHSVLGSAWHMPSLFTSVTVVSAKPPQLTSHYWSSV